MRYMFEYLEVIMLICIILLMSILLYVNFTFVGLKLVLYIERKLTYRLISLMLT